MMFRLLLLAVALAASAVKGTFIRAGTECTINITNATDVPLVISGYRFAYPGYGQNKIIIKNGDTAEFACPGNNITNVDQGETDLIVTTCTNGKLKYKNKIIVPETLKCGAEPIHSARYTNKTCELKGREIEIGYAVSTRRFVRHILVCFDDTNQITLYSHFNLTGSIGSQGHEIPRPYFIEDKFYSLGASVNSLYVRGGQRKTINAILSLPENSTRYVQNGMEFFLARGHFTAKADFIYATQQRATFYYINAAPQWQVFNAGNWVAVEMSTRALAQKRDLDLAVYTGSYGVATLPDAVTGGYKKLYLYVNGKTKALPVPKLYWKVLFHRESRAGVALVGVNNPYLKSVGSNRVCTDVSDQLDWLQWDAKNFTAGYSYACTVDDLRKTVKHIPVLDIKKLLV